VSWDLEEDEKELVLALSAPERYGYFIQLAVDGEEAWGLKNAEGWVLAGDEDRDAFPIWPHPDLAAACALGDWAGAVPEAIGLEELLDDLIPILEEDGIGVAVFPGLDGESAVVAPEDFRRDLEAEIELGAGDDEHDHDHDPENDHDKKSDSD
jgi:hypothetical protein